MKSTSLEHSLELQRALAGLATQVLKRIRSEERLLHGAMHDKLTGLANRHVRHVRLDSYWWRQLFAGGLH